MRKILLTILNIFYVSYLVFISIIYELSMPFYFLYFMIRNKGKIDDFFRHHNWMYGHYLVRGSWPYIRSRVVGEENIPDQVPSVIVLNHRSFLDIFFSALVPVPNQMVIVRNWVFNLKLFGWSMRLAKYPNIDQTSPEDLIRIGKDLMGRNVSFQFYPEGHRSKDGKLRRFRNGAFFMASENNMPILPVIMIGTNDFGSYRFPFFKPARIFVEILKPVYPVDFEEEQRPLKMRKHVEKIYRDYLGE